MLSAGVPFIAADVGGTHARMALVRNSGDGTVEILEHEKYLCTDFPSLDAVLRTFLGRVAPRRVDVAAMACAGVLRGDSIISANLAWPVSLAALRGTDVDVAVVNDFVAVAHATQCLVPTEGVLLTRGVEQGVAGPMLVVGPGTGFGAALRIPLTSGFMVLPSEAGHMAFAPTNPAESKLLAHVQSTRSHVDTEHFVSGPGLLRLYLLKCEMEGVHPRYTMPSDLPQAARAGDALAGETLRTFCGMFGSLVADIVIATGATSVYIAGGIGAKIVDFLGEGTFANRFLDKGPMRPVLEGVPVRLIDNPHKGVIGAATWYLAQRAV